MARPCSFAYLRSLGAADDDAGRGHRHPIEAQLQDQGEDVFDGPGGWCGQCLSDHSRDLLIQAST
jgi:hypothetical protein